MKTKVKVMGHWMETDMAPKDAKLIARVQNNLERAKIKARAAYRSARDHTAKIEAANDLLILFNSEDRLPELLRIVGRAPASVFWPVYFEWGNVYDRGWVFQVRLLLALRRQHQKRPAYEFMSDDARAFYDALPDPVPVYRGCSLERVRASSWTTDRGVAEGFANGHRGKGVPHATVAEGIIPKSAVLAVFVDRQESEVVVDFGPDLTVLKAEAL